MRPRATGGITLSVCVTTVNAAKMVEQIEMFAK